MSKTIAPIKVVLQSKKKWMIWAKLWAAKNIKTKVFMTKAKDIQFLLPAKVIVPIVHRGGMN